MPRALYGFAARAFLSKVAKGLCRRLCRLRHLLLCVHLRYLKYGEGVALVHEVAFFDANLHHAGWQLATYTVFTNLDFTLYDLIGLAQSEEAYDCDY